MRKGKDQGNGKTKLSRKVRFYDIYCNNDCSENDSYKIEKDRICNKSVNYNRALLVYTLFYSTTNTYTLKRKILTFTNKISRCLSKPDKKFTTDITYGMLAAESCLLTDVVGQLHESSKKINIVDRLSKHLEKGTPKQAAASYLRQVKQWVPKEPVIHIDDSDIVKPDGY